MRGSRLRGSRLAWCAVTLGLPLAALVGGCLEDDPPSGDPCAACGPKQVCSGQTCEDVCVGLSCGSDHGVSCGECGPKELCSFGLCEDVCIGVSCGDDQGVSCGTCATGEGCVDGACDIVCVGMQCGSDRGVSCGACGPKEVCTDAGSCEAVCVGMACGSDRGISCGSCEGKSVCDSGTSQCTPVCIGMECGVDQGVECGPCAGLSVCTDASTCEPVCVEMSCGVDQGLVCGICNGNATCVHHRCCVPGDTLVWSATDENRFVRVRGATVIRGGPTGLQTWDFATQGGGSVVLAGDFVTHALHESYLYVRNEATQVFFILDVASPLNPQNKKTMTGMGAPWHAQDGILFVTATTGGALDLHSLADPLNPVKVGTIPFIGSKGIAKRGSLVAVASNDAVRLFDVADLAAPAAKGSVGLPGADIVVRNAAFAGDRLYVMFTGTGEKKGLHIYDVSDPSAPVAESHVPMPTGRFAVDGHRLVAAGGPGLEVYDVTDSSTPTFVEYLDNPAGQMTVWADLDGQTAIGGHFFGFGRFHLGDCD